MQNKKKVRIFAGPNGSGKSTLFVEFSKIYQTGFFVNADFIEKKLFESGFFNLEEVGLFASQNDLDNFKNSTDAISLLNKTAKEGHIIDIFVKDNFIVDKSISTHSYEGAFIASFIRYLMTLSKKSFSYETVMSHNYRTLENLHLLTPICYRAYFFDNSGKQQKLIAESFNGKLELKIDFLPNWFITYVLPYYIHK
jgi:predicted ABC-type ATPase